MEFIFLIQARLGSKRLPKKVLKPVFQEISLLEVVYERVLLSKYATRENVYILTSDSITDDELVDFLELKQIRYYRGDELNVFKRYKSFLQNSINPSTYFFRICSDNPFIEPLFINEMCHAVIDSSSDEDYISYIDSDHVPIIKKKYGMFCELVNTSTFLNYSVNNEDSDTMENVTSFLYNSSLYNKIYLELPKKISGFNLCIDTKEDYLKCLEVFHRLNKIDFDFIEVIDVL